MPARVTGLDGDWWVHRDVLERGPGDARTVLLSPFDRLVYDRERTAELFGFRYRLEMYVAPAKREFGYYVLPILHGTQLIGRVDGDGRSAGRGPPRRRPLGRPRAPSEAGADVAGALRELASWRGAERVEVGRRVPRMWAKELRA